MGQLTRAEMEQVIKDGGSVLHNGQTLWQVNHLPSEVELAKGDPAAEAAVQAALDTQIRQLQQQRDKLAARGQSSTLQPVARPETSGATKPQASDTAPLAEALGPDIADRLAEAGYSTKKDVRAASDEQLLAVPGIGEATLKKIRAALPEG